MALTRAEQRAIMRADEERRTQRLIAEYAALAESGPRENPDAMAVRSDARAMGATTALTTRVTGDNWTTRYTLETDRYGQTHARKVGPVRAVGSDVKVIHADGRVETRSVDSFRKSRAPRTSKRQTSSVNHAATYAARVERFGANDELAEGDA